MRADEYKLVGEVLEEIFNELAAEYVEQIIEATKATDSVGVAAIAMRVVVLRDIVGTIVARGRNDSVAKQPETDSDE
jgi:hypothetical protein